MMALLFLIGGADGASAQQCPRASATGPDTPSRAQSLEGRLIHHDGIRQWFELRLDKRKCDQSSIQLVRLNDSWRALDIIRGCRVRSRGPIEFSGTGYFSLDLYQDVSKIEPVGPCTRKPAFHDYSTAKPDAHVRSYTVDMHVDYRPGDHPIMFHVRSAGRDLRPWQAYAGYMLTGSFVLYGSCGDGFVVDRVHGTPAAHPSHFDDSRTSSDRASFDPESAAALGKHDLHLGYTCIREPVGKH